MRRPLWLGAGVVLGAGGTVWAQLRFRRLIRRLPALLASLGPARRRTAASADAGHLPGRRSPGEAGRPTGLPDVAPIQGAGAVLGLAARRAVTRAGIGLARAAVGGAIAQKGGSPARR